MPDKRLYPGHTAFLGLLVGMLLLLSSPAKSQEAGDYLTDDELYELAREHAFEEKNYEKARELAYRALKNSPNYHGIRVFVARTFAWEGKYGKAREELRYVLERDSDNRQALSAMIDVETWDGNYRQVLKWSKRALKEYPHHKKFLLSRGSALEQLERYDEAEKAYNATLEQHPDSRKARQWLETLRLKRMKHEATLSYRHDFFGEIDPWKFAEMSMSRQTQYGAVIGRLQWANRFASDGLQFNIDAYPTILEGLYAYVSAGYSGSSIYPQYRFGLSLYKSLPAAFELSAGFRHLDFDTTRTTFYTLALTKYKGSYMFRATSYVVPNTTGSLGSVYATARRYFGNASTYIGISGGYGSTSSEIRFQQDLQRIKSWMVEVDGQYPLNERINIGGNVGFESEELRTYTRDRVRIKAFISYRF